MQDTQGTPNFLGDRGRITAQGPRPIRQLVPASPACQRLPRKERSLRFSSTPKGAFDN